ncbi:bestrophin family protein [Tenacibaculum sp. TC6]|uniref:bestrophin family protein n=1 Tax=Tenacibaculum sp. TC6 TaxID=3423223 RepID=UPI003D36390D
MITTKSISFQKLLKWSGHHFLWLIPFMATVALLYTYNILNFRIPWIPVSVIGTAVAFYVGFKNNQAYDRMWEARKIWGGIVNESRTWGMMTDSYVSNLFTDNQLNSTELHSIKKRLVYRHIAWLYSHRSQLLVATPWEHSSQDGHIGKYAKYYQKKFGIGLVDDEVTKTELQLFLSEEEYNRLINHANTATQIINEQAKDLQTLRERNIIDDFRHVEMVEVLRSFYTLQGKNERIKKFPLPRQYANMSRYFVGIFIALLPFSMIPEMLGLGTWGFGLSIPITALVGWIYICMEIVGDYSENPFQGMANDIPMLSLCRTIEIDLREMLGETDLPPSIESKNGVLM